MTKRLFILAVYAGLVASSGCGAQSMLLGTEGTHLFTALDALARPDEQVQLRTRLQGGDFLQPSAGYVVRFYQDGKLFKAAETDADGVASVSFTPGRPGDYWFTAEVAAAGLPDAPPSPQQLLVTSRRPDTPIAIIDLDKTIVASGFHKVLIGDPEKMPNSPQVLQRLSKTHTIVYLTHRPDYFGVKSKAWLKKHSYPTGPLLLSSIRGFLKGSGAFKSEMLRNLQSRFDKIEIGIGDKISDAVAYHDNGMRSVLILHPPAESEHAAIEKLADELAEMPDEIQVVTSWDQVEQALFEGASFPAADAEQRMRDMLPPADNGESGGDQ